MSINSKGGEVSRGQAMQDYERKLHRTNMVVAITSSLGILLGIIENYMLWEVTGEKADPGWCNLLKMAISVSTLLTVAFLAVWYHQSFQQSKVVNQYLKEDSFWSSGMLHGFCWEFVAVLVHPIPGFEMNVMVSVLDVKKASYFQVGVSVDAILVWLMMMLRSYMMFRCLRYAYGIESGGTRAAANFNKVNFDNSFAMSYMMNTYAWNLLTYYTFITIIIFSYSLKVFEREADKNFDHFQNCIWVAISSITGAGNNDIIPHTTPGRLLTMMLYLFGLAAQAMVVVCAIEIAKVSASDGKVIKYIESARSNRHMRDLASRYIQHAWRCYRQYLMSPSSSLIGHIGDDDFCLAMRAFRSCRKQSIKLKDDNAKPAVFNEVLLTRERMQVQFKGLEERLEDMDYKVDMKLAAMNDLLQKNLKYLKHLSS